MNDRRPEPHAFVRPRGAFVAPPRAPSACDRARLLGWRINPEDSPRPPHGWQQCSCLDGVANGRLCACACHARALYVYKRA